MAPITQTGSDRRARPRGIALLGALILVAALGVGMAALGTVWQSAAQQEKEAELLFVGDQFRQAIESFQDAPAGGLARLPKNFDELLFDTRFPYPVRHLRRLWRDPLTGSTEWGLILGNDSGIAGVYSLAKGAPRKTANFPPEYEEFKDAKSYEDWRFEIAAPPTIVSN
jgi:type II secretory pathway pseudopilin PulG